MPGIVSGKPKLKFGVVSDVHIRLGLDAKAPLKSHDTTTLQHTFEWFRDQGVDAVMIAGDMSALGLGDELMLVGKTWDKVFPDDRAPDGRKVEKLFIYGNHDCYPAFSISDKNGIWVIILHQI